MPALRAIVALPPHRILWRGATCGLLGGACLFFAARGMAQTKPAVPVAEMAQTVQIAEKALPVGTDVDVEIPDAHVTVNELVTFNVRLSNPAPYKKWQVVFGDGSVSEWSTAATATHKYQAVGPVRVYAIYATFDGDKGRPVSQSRAQTMQVDPPREDLTPATSVKLTASTTHLLVGQSVNFQLELNNGAKLPDYTFRSGEPQVQNEQAEASFVHTYKIPGKYWASVDVHGLGRRVSDAVELTVDEVRLGAYAEPVDVNIGENVHFTARGPAPEIANVFYFFNFGDKQRTNWSATPAADHAFRGEGVYSATVELGILEGKTVRAVARSAPVKVTVRVEVPSTVALQWSPTEPEMDQEVLFEAKPANVPKVLLGYRFNFGDGISSEVLKTPAVKYRYSTPGWQSPVVEIGPLSRGANGLVLEKVLATSPAERLWVKKPPGLILTPTQVSGVAGREVTFKVEMSDGSSVPGFQFDPGDGSEATVIKVTQFTHVYPTGQFTAIVSLKKSHAEASVTMRAPTLWERLQRGWEQTPTGARWLLAAIGVLAIAAVARQIFRRLRPQVMVRARTNVPPKFLPGPKPPAIVFSIRLNPALNRATCRFSPDAGIIQSEETRHD